MTGKGWLSRLGRMIIVQFVKTLRRTLGNSPKNSPNLCGEFLKSSRHIEEDVPGMIHLMIQIGMHKVQKTFPAEGMCSG